MTFKVVPVTLASAVSTSGTFTVSYPAGTNAGTFKNAVQHKLNALGGVFTSPKDFAITTWGATTATITWRATPTLPVGTLVRVQLNIPGPATYRDGKILPSKVAGSQVFRISLGAPATASSSNICASQAITAAAGGTLNGTTVVSGVAVLDVPRAVVAAWTGTAVMTVTGTDELGNVVKESSASGTSLTGKKAFKTITSVAVSADVTGATVGTGDVLGLPVFLPSTGLVLKELEDGATATSGTLVAGLATTTVSTATTADVRGTYDPNSACDGVKAFDLIVALTDPTFTGNPQYAG